MDNPEISMIIPVYKVENSLNRCIDSVLSQSYANFELILVDDGSPDNCGKICDDYAQKDRRIKVIHKKNEGVSRARNAGLDVAIGNYITFVDSDDYIDEDYLMIMHKAITDNQSDMVICGVRYRDYNNSENFNEQIKISDFTTDKKNYIQVFPSLLGQRKLNYIYSKLYKRNILDTNKIRFNTNMNLGEDTIFVCDVLKFTNRITVIGNCYYNYIMYPSGTLTTQFRENIFEIYLYITNYIMQTMLCIGCFNSEIINVLDDRKIISAIWSIDSIRSQKRISTFCKVKLIKKIIKNKELVQSLKRRKQVYNHTDIKLIRIGSPILLVFYYNMEPIKLKIKGIIRRYTPDNIVRWYKQWTLK